MVNDKASLSSGSFQFESRTLNLWDIINVKISTALPSSGSVQGFLAILTSNGWWIRGKIFIYVWKRYLMNMKLCSCFLGGGDSSMQLRVPFSKVKRNFINFE